MEAMVAEERARVAQGAKQGGSPLQLGCSGSSTPKIMRKPVQEGIPPHNADRSTNQAARPDESTLAAEAADLPMPSLCDHDFPDVVLSIICRFLTARELARLACVSRRFTQRTLTEPGTSGALLSPIEDAARLRLAAAALTMGGHSSWVRALWAAECPRDRTWRCCGGGSGAYSTRLTLRRNGTFEVFNGYMSRAGQSGNEESYITGRYTISIESGVHELALRPLHATQKTSWHGNGSVDKHVPPPARVQLGDCLTLPWGNAQLVESCAGYACPFCH